MFFRELRSLFVLRVLAPRHPDLADFEARELIAETGNVILMGMRGDHDRELLSGGRPDMIDRAINHVEVALRVHSAVNEHVFVSITACLVRNWQRHQKTIAKTDPIHAHANRVGAKFRGLHTLFARLFCNHFVSTPCERARSSSGVCDPCAGGNPKSLCHRRWPLPWPLRTSSNTHAVASGAHCAHHPCPGFSESRSAPCRHPPARSWFLHEM